LPVVFVINSNQWAISVPRHRQCAAKQLTDKATAAGFTDVQVDGNNFGVILTPVAAAIARARAGKSGVNRVPKLSS
jgi:2-oxoisovalerate dehydrogenase E1 component alpha subunit|tara:strand:- start:561 stop:788 length:228 start_codon:yes stop_codon:yes gene_type:complete